MSKFEEVDRSKVLLHGVGDFGTAVAARLGPCLRDAETVLTEDLLTPSYYGRVNGGTYTVVTILSELPSAEAARAYLAAQFGKHIDSIALLRSDDGLVLMPKTSTRNMSGCWGCAIQRIQQHRETKTGTEVQAPSAECYLEKLASSWLELALRQDSSELYGRTLFLTLEPFSMFRENLIPVHGCVICDNREEAVVRTVSALRSEVSWLWEGSAGAAQR